MTLLPDRVVVVTAAAGTGIGSAVARRCLEEGARVVISDAHPRRLGEAHADLAADFGDRLHSLPCDVTVQDDVDGLIAGTVSHFGRIDVMVNNAGLGGTGSVLDLSDDDWSRVLDVTLTGTFRCMRAALRQMVDQGGGGAIVNNASVLGWRAQAGQAHYAAAKAGVMALTRCAALDVAQHGIRVNAVAPGLISGTRFSASSTDPAAKAKREPIVPLRRTGTAEDVAPVVVFLLGDGARYVSGQVIWVDGGLGVALQTFIPA
jgi:3-oxoacyl-[acyl-carrier protein] reductase